jgi:hypothetical protein
MGGMMNPMMMVGCPFFLPGSLAGSREGGALRLVGDGRNGWDGDGNESHDDGQCGCQYQRFQLMRSRAA